MGLRWVGPFRVRDYLENAISPNAEWGRRWPCDRDAVYVVSQSRWRRSPTEQAHVLYVGSNTGRASRFVTRVGDLIADMHGFFGGGSGHHSGGQTLWHWCNHARVHPGDLWLAWARSSCTRCDERGLYKTFPKAVRDDFSTLGLRNKKSPPICVRHS